MVNLDKFTPLDVASKSNKKRGGRKGALTMICSKKNGKRLMLSAELLETLNLEEDLTLQMGFIEETLVMAKKLPGENNRFVLKKSGKKYAIYSAEAVRKISSVQGLSFEKKVSFTWYMPVVDEVNGVPVVMFRPEKGGAGDES